MYRKHLKSVPGMVIHILNGVSAGVSEMAKTFTDDIHQKCIDKTTPNDPISVSRILWVCLKRFLTIFVFFGFFSSTCYLLTDKSLPKNTIFLMFKNPNLHRFGKICKTDLELVEMNGDPAIPHTIC